MFDTIERACLEAVHIKADPATGLRAIIAVHSTRFGPALGGCRFLPYSSDKAALLDAARLARGMSYKAALAGVPQGGGKAVLIKPPGEFDRVALFRAFGRLVESLDGRYITAVDSGSTLADMDQVALETRHVSGSTGDGLNPSPETAYGVFCAMRAAWYAQTGEHDLSGRLIAIQGLGQVGWSLADMLHQQGARLLVSDIDPARVQAAVERFRAIAVAPERIHAQVCAVFAPCALGAVLNADTVRQMHCRLVVGSANNQLATPDIGDWLDQHGILYVPDYVANAGGLIKVSLGKLGHSKTEIRRHTERIADTVTLVLRHAYEQQRSPADVADQMAEAKLRAPLASLAMEGQRYALSH